MTAKEWMSNDYQSKITLGPPNIDAWSTEGCCSYMLLDNVWTNAKYGIEHCLYFVVNNDMQYQSKPHYVYFL
jgi:hypothetical protein